MCHLFYFEQILCDFLMEIFVRFDDLLSESVGILEESSDLLIDELASVVGHIFASSLSRVWSIVLSSEIRVKSVSHHHRSRDLRRSLDI